MEMRDSQFSNNLKIKKVTQGQVKKATNTSWEERHLDLLGMSACNTAGNHKESSTVQFPEGFMGHFVESPTFKSSHNCK